MPAKLKPPVFPPIQKLHGVPRELQEIQQNISKATEAARRNETNAARTIDVTVDPTAPSGFTRLSHKLGKKPRGYEVIAKLGPGDATFRDRTKRDGGGNSDDPNHTSRHMDLQAAGTTPAKFRIRVW